MAGNWKRRARSPLESGIASIRGRRAASDISRSPDSGLAATRRVSAALQGRLGAGRLNDRPTIHCAETGTATTNTSYSNIHKDSDRVRKSGQQCSC